MSSYAFGGEPGQPGTLGLEFAKPIPVHAQTPEALEAVESVRRAGRAARLQREVSALATDHGTPRIRRYDGGIPANARRLEKAARAAGFDVRVLDMIDGCRIEGHHAQRRVGFRATWTEGKADGASWHAPWKYTLVNDERPVGVNKLTRTGLANKRPAGVGTTRLAIIASPRGIAITHTELLERVSTS